jgi:hypothetical protein
MQYILLLPLKKLRTLKLTWPLCVLPDDQPKQCWNGFYIDIYQCSVNMNLKGLHFANVVEIQEGVTDELKKVQRRNFRQLLRKCRTAQKPVYLPMELILNLKKVCVFLTWLRFLKKLFLKFMDCTLRNLYVKFVKQAKDKRSLNTVIGPYLKVWWQLKHCGSRLPVMWPFWSDGAVAVS